MTKLHYKEQVTKNVILELGDDSVWSFEEALKKWWMVPRSDRGLRLTEAGDLAFRYAKIEFFNFDFTIAETINWHSFILELNKKIRCPYYIAVNRVEDSKKPYIRLYDSKIALLINLYGNINEYLESIKVRT
jgi:hypothetical protein